MINFKKNYILNFLLFWEMIFYFFIYINQSPIVPFCVYHWSQILRKSLFFWYPKRIGFKVVIFGQMGTDRRRRRWCAVVLIGIVAVAMTVSASDSHKKQKQPVSRIAFGSCNNQSAPQVSILFFLFCHVLCLSLPMLQCCLLKMIFFLCFNHDVPVFVLGCCL